jgi:ABC-type sugar transport system ATPase subunit
VIPFVFDPADPQSAQLDAMTRDIVLRVPAGIDVVATGEKVSEQKSGNGKPDHLLALKGFSKSFGPVQALSDVDFEVDGGEVVALVGDNGAGKSTLIKAIDGVQPPDSGQAYFEGKPVKITDPNSATKLGIATVFQDLALCDNLDVVANLYLGQEVVGTGGVPLPVINETEMEQHTNELPKVDNLY